MNNKKIMTCFAMLWCVVTQGQSSQDGHKLYTFKSIEDSTDQQPANTAFGINSGWSMYKDIIFPGTKIDGTITQITTFEPGKQLLNCRITSGDTYNNLFFINTLAKKWKGENWYFKEANTFAYSMDFFVDNHIDCKTPNLSQLEGLEFTFQQALPPYSFLWGLQWSKSNVWSYWDDNKIGDRAKGWVNIAGLSACLLNGKWNHIRITGHRSNKALYYDMLYLNDFPFKINKRVARTTLPENFAENYLQVGFQINGDKAIRKDHAFGTDPVSTYLDNVMLQVEHLGNR